MSALEMFMTTWNVWKSYVQANKQKGNAPALAPAPVKRAACEGEHAAKRFAPADRCADPRICKPEDLADLSGLIFASVPPASSRFELRVESSKYRAISALLKAWKAWKDEYAAFTEKKQAAAAAKKAKEEEIAAKEAAKEAAKAQKDAEKEAARKALEDEKAAKKAKEEEIA